MMNISNELADRRGSSPTAEIATKHVVSKSSSGFIETCHFPAGISSNSTVPVERLESFAKTTRAACSTARARQGPEK
jgi:hypothetical protein